MLNAFALTSGGDGTNYATSLVTAGALENFIENVLQPSLLTVQAGQSPGVRVGTISTTSPSNINVPSCLAVSNFVAAGNYLTPVPSNTDATRIADGTVSNAEFQYLNGVTSAIQTQLDGKQPTGSYLTSVPVPNIVLNVSQNMNLKVGNVNTGNVNSNSLNAWLPLYTQSNVLQLSQSFVLTSNSRPVRIDTNIPFLINRANAGFRVVCNNGTSVSVIPGTTNWRTSAASGDDDTPSYCTSVVHTPGGTGSLTYTIEAYVLARFGGVAPIVFINPGGLAPTGNLQECTMLITEL